MTPAWFAQGDSAEGTEVLLERYLDVLRLDNLVQLARDETKGRLSGLFLPSVSKAYLQSPVRVMLVGQEPREWVGSISELTGVDPANFSLREYVRRNMARHQENTVHLQGKVRFMRLYSDLLEALDGYVAPGPDAIIWGNVLCASLNQGSPVSGSAFKQVQKLSHELLALQFEVLRPDIVIFACGWRYDRFIKPIIWPWKTLKGFISKHFWPFEAPNFLGYRVPHPRVHTRDFRTELLQRVRQDAEHLMKVKHY